MKQRGTQVLEVPGGVQNTLALTTYFHSGPDAVYFENIPIFMAGHRSRFKVVPLCTAPHFSCLPSAQEI